MMTHVQDEAFGAGLTRLAPFLQAGALSLTRNGADAADLVQETLMKAWRARARFQAGTNLTAWLVCIMRNTHLSNLRRRGRECPAGLDDYAACLAAPPSQEWSAAAGRVRREIDRLPADQADAFVQVAMLGRSYEAAAAAAGCVPGTMKSRVSRTRRTLRERACLDHLLAH